MPSERRRTARDRNPVEEHRALAESAADLPVADEAEPPGRHRGRATVYTAKTKCVRSNCASRAIESKPPSEALVISTSSSMSAGSASSARREGCVRDPIARRRTRGRRAQSPATSARRTGPTGGPIGARRCRSSSGTWLRGAAPGVGNGAPDVDPVTVTRSVADFALSMSVPLSSTERYELDRVGAGRHRGQPAAARERAARAAAGDARELDAIAVNVGGITERRELGRVGRRLTPAYSFVAGDPLAASPPEDRSRTVAAGCRRHTRRSPTPAPPRESPAPARPFHVLP